ncbi:hypothetical protein DW228_15620 [Bacteroides fragilis]|uniref:Uncharacterized protein n=1 Tax=Bacteroides fragilis TaxID=817 RepID=A0A396BRT1_BACFG|nr:hypothetical protein DW228_15620 [Bacteroides fragilis]RHH69218.1 hypothetical protein DW198_06870 [Bacteroides fragilis]
MLTLPSAKLNEIGFSNGVFAAKREYLRQKTAVFQHKDGVFPEKEVSIRTQRSKHFPEMLTSFPKISSCFATLHILL